MRIILALAALLVLSGCGSMDFTTVSVSSGYSHYYPSSHISYTLGFYRGSHYNGHRVHGSYGHRYYYAPRHYNNHHYYSTPVVHHYVRPRPHHVTAHHRTPPRNHHNNHNTRQDRRGHRERNRH